MDIPGFVVYLYIMRIITPNICRECCYCIEEGDNVAVCCRNMIYKPVKLNQTACKHFAGEEEQSIEDNYSCII